MFIEKISTEEKETLKRLCNDCKVYQLTEAEAKKAKEETKEKIKAILDKYGYNAKETLDIYKIEYQEQTKNVVDTDALRACGLYDKFSKTQTIKPLTVK